MTDYVYKYVFNFTYGLCTIGASMCVLHDGGDDVRLCVRFDVQGRGQRRGVRRLAAETVEAIKANGRVRSSTPLIVEGQLLQRILDELYWEKAASRRMKAAADPAATSTSGSGYSQHRG